MFEKLKKLFKELKGKNYDNDNQLMNTNYEKNQMKNLDLKSTTQK